MTNQSIGAPLSLACSASEAVGREPERDLAGDDHVVEHRVPAPHRDAVGGDDVAEQLQALRLAEAEHDLREPVVVLGLDREPPLPARVEQVAVGLRQLVLFDQVGVVGLHEGIEIDRGPFAVGRDRSRDEIGEQRRLHLGEQLLARQRLERRARRHHDADLVAARLGLVEHARHHGFGIPAPGLDLDAVFLGEGLGQRSPCRQPGSSRRTSARLPSWRRR